MKPNYYFIAVATKEHLRKCLEISMAGFPDTYSGLWAYVDINVGDYVTLVHGAWAYNLYKVQKKVLAADYKHSEPWIPLQKKGKNITSLFDYASNLRGSFRSHWCE